MVKYIDGDFGPEHFSKDFGFTNSAYDNRAAHNRRSRQRDGVADNDAAVGEGGDGTYVSRSRGGRLHRATGGSAGNGGSIQAPSPNMIPGNRLPNEPSNPGNETLGGPTVTVPVANVERAANMMIQIGRNQGARQAMATAGAHMPPGAAQSLVANPPVHTPGIPGLKKGGRAPVPTAEHPKGVLLIIAGRPAGASAPMTPVEKHKDGGRLTAKERHALPASDFALPGGRYPVNDENHARNALARVAQHGTPSEQARVRAAVHRKYPDIGKR